MRSPVWSSGVAEVRGPPGWSEGVAVADRGSGRVDGGVRAFINIGLLFINTGLIYLIQG